MIHFLIFLDTYFTYLYMVYLTMQAVTQTT
jgi:hypothetical protein